MYQVYSFPVQLYPAMGFKLGISWCKAGARALSFTRYFQGNLSGSMVTTSADLPLYFVEQLR
jgi:hypothetical protein